MTLTEPSRRERKKEETRRRIFEVAIALFREKGFEATTVDEITEKADVARGTFFNYFPKKESVLTFLSADRLAAAKENADALLADPSPVREKLIHLYLLAAGAWNEDRELSQFVFGEWLKRVFTPTAETALGWRELVVALLAQARDNGELRADLDIARAHELLTSVYMTTLFQWLFRPVECLAHDFDLREELRARFTLVFDGLQPRDAGVRP